MAEDNEEKKRTCPPKKQPPENFLSGGCFFRVAELRFWRLWLRFDFSFGRCLRLGFFQTRRYSVRVNGIYGKFL